MSPTPIVLINHDCKQLTHEYLVDLAEMLTVVTQTKFGIAAPHGWDECCVARVGQSIADIAPGEWPCGFFSHPDVANALGYHDVLADGRPALHCFPDLESDPEDISVTVSHEVFEALADPSCVLSAVGTDGVVRALEPGDPVETTWWLYTCLSGRQLRVSNWVLLAWFGGCAGPLDYLGICKTPGEILPGGYQITFDPTNGWSQQTAGIKRAYRREMGTYGKTRLNQRAERMFAK